jgi:hypothetical protein
MACSSFESCKHGNQKARDLLDSLPISQAGAGRHNRAQCADEAGIQEGIRRQKVGEAADRRQG